MTLYEAVTSFVRWRDDHLGVPTEVRIHPYTWSVLVRQMNNVEFVSVWPRYTDGAMLLCGVPVVKDVDANIDWCEWRAN